MSIRAKYTLAGAMLATAGVLSAIYLPGAIQAWRDLRPGNPEATTSTDPVTPVPIGGQAGVTINARELHGTIVTPHLEYPITGDKNVLWCATFQIAWNELCDLLGGPVASRRSSEMVEILNKKAVTRADLDEASYIALAGYPTGGPDDILDRITAALKKKFGETANARLIPRRRSLDHNDWVAYAYMFKELPFEWAFDRLEWPLTFAGWEVEVFGIHQLYRRQENEVKAAGQALTYGYGDPNGFVVELKTRSKSDRLILARVNPSATLLDTIRTVQKRLAADTAQPMQEMGDLEIPVIDFDVFRQYNELPRPGYAAQQIRFKLDETGAVLRSEAVVVKAKEQRLIFDKPFLVMIQRTDAQMPYVALWVANAELLVPAQPGR